MNERKSSWVSLTEYEMDALFRFGEVTRIRLVEPIPFTTMQSYYMIDDEFYTRILDIDEDGTIKIIDQYICGPGAVELSEVNYPYGEIGAILDVKERHSLSESGEIYYGDRHPRGPRRMPKKFSRAKVEVLETGVVFMELNNLTSHGLDMAFAHCFTEYNQRNLLKNMRENGKIYVWRGRYRLLT